MQSSSALLSPILRSDTQGKMLAELFLHPEREMSLLELAHRIGVAPSTVLRDVDRLVTGGALKDRRQGRSRLISVNTDHPIYRPMREIVLFGPAASLPELLSDVPNIESAFIYGSWAERYSGVPGRDPDDVDVLIVRTPDRVALREIARQASAVVGREVNFNIISTARWESSEDSFVLTVTSRPLLKIATNGDN